MEDIYAEESVAQEPVESETDIAKCPSCGANMVFSPEKHALECPYCGTIKPLEISESEEKALENLINAEREWIAEAHVFRCENCGAREVLRREDIAKKCSFCGTTNIVETDELPGVKPNAVVPFKIEVDTAIEKFKAWVKKKFFAPSKFKKEVKAENISGVYNPAFTFDTNTHSSYSGVLGKYYYKTVRVNGKTVRRRYTRYFNISGTFDMFFDDVLIQASTVIEQKSLEKLQPFDTNQSREYDKGFLSGYTATQYTKDGMACWSEAKKKIDARLRSAILSQYTYDVVSSFNVSTMCSNVTYKYVLLPLYVGHSTWKEKNYNFFVNGVNGKVTGKTPVSALKVGLVVLLGLLAVGGIVALAILG